jgi:proteasome lid subunit RPN8/RPN11
LVSDPAITTIRIPLLVWAKMIFQLRRRGAGKGESGAFFVGRRLGITGRVTTYICYDDLDPRAIQTGAITFHAEGYAALWQYCKREKLEILADAHTHPGASVKQSGIDRRHPMMPVVGHIAIIIPNYAHTHWWSLKSVGVYEYLGNFKWRTYGDSEKCRRIKLTIW